MSKNAKNTSALSASQRDQLASIRGADRRAALEQFGGRGYRSAGRRAGSHIDRKSKKARSKTACRGKFAY